MFVPAVRPNPPRFGRLGRSGGQPIGSRIRRQSFEVPARALRREHPRSSAHNPQPDALEQPDEAHRGTFRGSS